MTQAKNVAKGGSNFDSSGVLGVAGADTSAIVAEKQRLRDITKLADEATTLDELKGITL